jgi:hypothetical protein
MMETNRFDKFSFWRGKGIYIFMDVPYSCHRVIPIGFIGFFLAKIKGCFFVCSPSRLILLIISAALFVSQPGICGTKVETTYFVVDDVYQQLSADQLERFATNAEAAFIKAKDYWSIPGRTAQRGKILLELHREHFGYAFSVFQMEKASEGRRSVVRIYGIRSPQEMVHKLTHALFPTSDKLIRNMMGIPTEGRFGNLFSFPMCGYDVDSWAIALKRSGSYIPLKELGEQHEDWGMTFKGKTPAVSDRKRQHASYIEAGSFGTFLINKYGIEKVKAFYLESLKEARPWQQIFGLDFSALEGEWLKSLDESGKTNAHQIDVLEGLWKQNPKTACDKAQETATKK